MEPRRLDGGKQRTYRCQGYQENNGTCEATQFEAATVDAAVLSALDDLLPDFDAWIEQITERRSGEHDRLERECDRARQERDEAARRVEVAEERWLALDKENHELVLGALRRARQDCADAEKRLQAAQDALDATPLEAAADAVLDFAASLQRALRGIDTSGSMAQLNAALHEVFEGFLIWQEGHAIRIEPMLHMSVAHALLEQGKGQPGSTWVPWLLEPNQEPPPMQWIGAASRNSDYSQRNTS